MDNKQETMGKGIVQTEEQSLVRYCVCVSIYFQILLVNSEDCHKQEI